MVTSGGADALTRTFDVVICGGGPSGICAAIAAARAGAAVALIERHAFFGGMATAGMVTPISEYNKNGRRVIGGIPWEFAVRLSELGGARLDYYNGYVPFDQEIYKLVAQRMVLEAGALPVTGTWVSGVAQKAGTLTGVKTVNKSGEQEVKGRLFVDCTGDADVAMQAGVPMQPTGESLQPLTLWFRLGGVDTSRVEGIRLDGENVSGHNEEVRAYLKESGEEVTFGGPWFFEGPAPDVLNVNMSRAAGDAADWQSLQEAAFRLREDVFRLVALIKKGIPAFRNCCLLETAPAVGIRETRRIRGVHTVTGEELLACTQYPDSIARGAHPMDIHDAHSPAQKLTTLKDAYHIPFRCMVAKGYENLVVAGRSVSATREAQSTMRVMAPCMAEGEAAGVAAAMCAKDGVSVHSLDISALRNTLQKNGAIL